MSEPGQEDRLMVAMHEGVAYMLVCGRGTFKVSGALKSFGVAAVEEGCSKLVLDMANCVGMDSTFMGVLAGLAAQLTQRGEGRVVLVNLSDKTRGLLGTLGLDQVVEVHLAGSTPEGMALPPEVAGGMEALQCGEESRTATAETMLEAHENLITMSPENYPRFKDVLTFLREDLERAVEDETGPEETA